MNKVWTWKRLSCFQTMYYLGAHFTIFTKYLLHAGIVRRVLDTAKHKIGKNPCMCKTYIQMGKKDNKLVNYTDTPFTYTTPPYI